MFIPPKPKIKRGVIESLISRAWAIHRHDATPPKVRGLGIRGLEIPNRVGVVDDLLVWVEDGGGWVMEVGNLDPSRLGYNEAIGKPYCMLQEGIWDFYPGPHRGRRPAYRQADNAEVAAKLGITQKQGKFLVMRMWGPDDPRNKLEWGYQQINIHRMGISSTGSWACLTLPMDKSDKWCDDSQAALKRHKQKTIPIAIMNGPLHAII